MIDGGDQPTINYDANGNLTKYKGWTYSYDAQNRLTSAMKGSVSAQFYYDGKNRQIARNINGVVRFNSWDGWELLEEYSSSLNVVTGYLQGSTGVIKSWSAANTLYYYQDKLGSTTHVANASGQLAESYKYDLYGTPSYFSSTSQPINSSTVGVADLYAGERWIPELRVYDLRNRFMSPELGRFLQTDPIGFQGDASNLYRYCGNDPVDQTDPTGLDTTITGSDMLGSNGALRWTVAPEKGKPYSFISNVFGNATSLDGRPYGPNGPLPPGEYRASLYNSPKFGTTVIKLYTEGEGNKPTVENGQTATIVYHGQQRKDLEFHPYRSKTEKRPTDKEVTKAEKDHKTRDKLNTELAGSRSEGCPTVKQRDLQKTVEAIGKTKGEVIVRKFGN
jgi:RHS repeat-associated protein